MNDYAPEAMPSVQLSPIVRATNRKIAKNALKALTEGELQLVLEEFMIEQYQARRGAAILMGVAKQLEIMPWAGDRRK